MFEVNGYKNHSLKLVSFKHIAPEVFHYNPLCLKGILQMKTVQLGVMVIFLMFYVINIKKT